MSRYERICRFWRHHTQTARTKRQHPSPNVGTLRPCWPPVADALVHSACVPPGAIPRTSYGLAQGPLAPWGIPVIGSTEIVRCRHLAGGLRGNRSAGALQAHHRPLQTTALSVINASPWRSVSSPLAHAHDHTHAYTRPLWADFQREFPISTPRSPIGSSIEALFPCSHRVPIGVFTMGTAAAQQIRASPPLCSHVPL